VPLVVVERDGPFGDVEGEVAIGPVAVLSAAMGLAEEGVGQSFDGLADRLGTAFDLGTAPDRARDFDLVRRQRHGRIASPGLDVLDLTAVAIAIEDDGDDFDPRRREGIEQGSLVRREQFIRHVDLLALLLVPMP
jgi:hypothetical protein